MRRGPEFSRIVLVGRTFTYTGNGGFHTSSHPDIHAIVRRHLFHTDWTITEGRQGRVLGSGRAWTREGAFLLAGKAAQRPGLLRGGR